MLLPFLLSSLPSPFDNFLLIPWIYDAYYAFRARFGKSMPGREEDMFFSFDLGPVSTLLFFGVVKILFRCTLFLFPLSSITTSILASARSTLHQYDQSWMINYPLPSWRIIISWIIITLFIIHKSSSSYSSSYINHHHYHDHHYFYGCTHRFVHTLVDLKEQGGKIYIMSIIINIIVIWTWQGYISP